MRSIQGLLVLFQILGLFLVFTRDIANFNKTKLIFLIVLFVFVFGSIKLVQKFHKWRLLHSFNCKYAFSIGILEIYRLNPRWHLGVIWFSIGIVAFWIVYLTLKYVKLWNKLYYFYAFVSLRTFLATLIIGNQNKRCKKLD